MTRDDILAAEDRQFTEMERDAVSRDLLNWAIEHRDSTDADDAPAVLSAIRTGASMLGPDEADRLIPLLEPGHRIDTVLVALKMVGRIFEEQPADPPEDGIPFGDLAIEVCQVSEPLLNRYVIASSRSAAAAQLAVYALAAMGSGLIASTARRVEQLRMPWFAAQVEHDLIELRRCWGDRASQLAHYRLGCAIAVLQDVTIF